MVYYRILNTLTVPCAIQYNLIVYPFYIQLGVPGGSGGKESACNAEDQSLSPGLERSPGEGNSNPLL